MTVRRHSLQIPAPRGTVPWPTLRRPTWRADGVVLRAVGAIGMGALAIVIAGWSPGVVGVLAGVLTWLLLAARRALARRRSH